MKKEKLSETDLLLIVFSIYSITALTQNLWPFKINRLVAAAAIVVLALANLRKAGKLDVCIYIHLAFVTVYTFFISKSRGTNLVDCVYYATAFLQLLYFARDYSWEKLAQSVERLHKFLGAIVIIDLVIVLVELVNPQCYVLSWGDYPYFYGWTDSAHTISACCCLALNLAMVYFVDQKPSFRQLLVLEIYVYAILQTGARIYLIPSLMIPYLYLRKQVTPNFFKQVAGSVGLNLPGLLFGNAGMLRKILVQIGISHQSTSNREALDSFTNGRGTIWKADLTAWAQGTTVEKVFGRGFDFIYDWNLEKLGTPIGAHSDYVGILVCAGIVGLVCYLILTVWFLRRCSKGQDILTVLPIVGCMLIQAFMNGFYPYYHYFASFLLMVLAVKMAKPQYGEKLPGKELQT